MLKPFGLSHFHRMKIKSFAICLALHDQASAKTPFPHLLLCPLGSALLSFFGWAVILPATGPLHTLLLCLRSSPPHILLVKASYSSNSLSITSLGKPFCLLRRNRAPPATSISTRGSLPALLSHDFTPEGFYRIAVPIPPLACMM